MGLDIVELIVRIEEEFNIEVSDEDAEKFTTVGHISDYVAAKPGVSASEANVWERVHAIVVDELAIPAAKVHRSARLVEDLNLD